MSVSWIKRLLIIVAIQLGQLNSRLQAVSDLDSMNQYHFPPPLPTNLTIWRLTTLQRLDHALP